MITVQNDANSSKYSALFQEAFDFLKGNYSSFESTDPDRYNQIDSYISKKDADLAGTDAKARFTSVQEYFSHLKDIYDLGGKKFLMLPLDEPVFEIDANKREITVPSEFKKNGISVQGDEIAESLIFKINRFFDYSDLNEMVCQIQWQNADKEEGISNAFVVDASRSADYLYIMWPLTEEITKAAGTIKFSVRFYKVSGSELVYSFSTKIAQATINQGHDYPVENWTGAVDDASRSFMNSIANSKNTAADDANAPYFILNLDSMSPGVAAGTENADFNDGTVLEAYVDAVENPTQTLKVQAATTDTGIIGYQWMYTDEHPATIAEFGMVKNYYLVPEIQYMPTADGLNAVANKIYYKEDASSSTGYSQIDFDEAKENSIPLFEKYSVVKVKSGQQGRKMAADDPETLQHVVGLYHANAINNKGDNTATTESLYISFPSPKILDFAEGGDLEPNYFLNSSTKQGSIAVVPVIDAHGAKATYDWCYASTKAGPYYPIFGAASGLTAEEREAYTVAPSALESTTGLASSADGSELTIDNRPGYYKVIVTSTRNYDTIKKESAICKVTNALQAPYITSPEEDVTMSTLYGPVTFEIEVANMNNDLISEGLTYQWFAWIDGEPTAIEGATEATYTVPKKDVGAYYCEVTNHMGEFTAVKKSPTFNVYAYEVHEDDDDEPPVVPTPSEPELNGTIAMVPAASATTEHPENQSMVTFTKTMDGDVNVITINGDLSQLVESMSSDPNQQDAAHKWLAVDIDTGLGSLPQGLTWNGHELSAAELAEEAAAASANGLAAGHMVLFVKADELVNETKTVTITYNNKELIIRLLFEDTQG